MQIVHAPTEIAGQMGILCEGLRAKGHYSSGYNWFHSYLKYRGRIMNTDAYELSKLINTLDKYSDIIHFHNGNTFFRQYLDLSYLHEAGKKIVMHHWGNDVRSMAKVRQLNPYALPSSYLSDEEIHNNLSMLSKYIDTAIVQDYEVYPYVKDYYKTVHVLPLACKINDLPVSYPDISKKIYKVIHAPTNRSFKGSVYVEAAIHKLKQNTEFIYQAIENMSHEEALQAYREADIVIDQLMCGSYGMLSVEAMAMGKVVIAFIREDVRKNFPVDLPIVNSKPETVYEVLSGLINNPSSLAQIGRASREYVLKYHEMGVVTDQLCKIYQQL
ncbi:Glycosyltransferase involved in cell wall bisynthesis [Anaerovirgula multivorans]|uniref:Glycosyltransferase involved in cell wall bisynthesis n=1 Tax=Anaerovirgula multivorans TaxID=312168 RepID=A0A238ZRQ4_9FIRM|nr:glycosyltransferase [Anaerovirgula multivorans]SNR85343.1 Glycosyltransferase involved in cell wall bisynthesis [Anaerovirgula multivorans]